MIFFKHAKQTLYRREEVLSVCYTMQ